MKKKLNVQDNIKYKRLKSIKLFERISYKIFCKLCLKSSLDKNSFWLHIKSKRHLKNLKLFFFLSKFGKLIFNKSFNKKYYLTYVPFRILKSFSINTSNISFLIQFEESKQKKYYSKIIYTLNFFLNLKISVRRKNNMFLIYYKNRHFLLKSNKIFSKLNKIIIFKDQSL